MIPNPTLWQIAGILAEAKAVDEGAQQVAGSITKPPWQDIAWKNIAKAEADRGETDAALETTAHSERRSEERISQEHCGRRRASARFSQSHVACWYGPGATLEKRGISGDCQGQARAGQRAAADKVFEQILAETRELKDSSDLGGVQRASLFKLAAAQAEVGEESKRARLDRSAGLAPQPSLGLGVARQSHCRTSSGCSPAQAKGGARNASDNSATPARKGDANRSTRFVEGSR